jgi:hypothetical protein
MDEEKEILAQKNGIVVKGHVNCNRGKITVEIV